MTSLPELPRPFDVTLDRVSAGPHHDQPILRDLSLHLAAGEQVAIIGPSGAGKTTLLHLLALALAPSAGTVRHGGRTPWAERGSARRRSRQQVFLAPQLPPLPARQRVVLSVLAGRLATFGFWRSLRCWVYPSAAEIALAGAALAQFDLAGKLFDRVDRLSGGERQRVGLARGLVSPARLWLVDEPLAALDPVRALQAVETLTQAARACGATLVVSFHQVDVALAHFPRVLGLRAGQVVLDRPPAAIGPEDLAQLYGGEGLPAPLLVAADGVAPLVPLAPPVPAAPAGCAPPAGTAAGSRPA